MSDRVVREDRPAVTSEVPRRRVGDVLATLRVLLLEGPYALVRTWLKRKEWAPELVRPGLASASIVAVTVVRDELLRLEYHLRYYRSLGVEHFVIVDNGSTDGSVDYLREQPDVSLFRATGVFAQSRYAVDWVNGILTRHCAGTWVLWVDADELLVFSGDAQTPLRQLVDELDRQGMASLQTLMLDMYSDRPSAENVLESGQDPLTVCALYDESGYRQVLDRSNGTRWIKGGVRGRVFFADDPDRGPALNKTPLVKWRRGYAFMKVAHQLWPNRLNGGRRLGGVLLHFKFTRFAASKVADPEYRAQHTQEYDKYDDLGSVRLVGPPSTRFDGLGRLVTRGTVEPYV